MKDTFKRYGLNRAERKIRRIYRQWREARNFQKWIKLDDAAKPKNLETIRQEIENFTRSPLISVLLPVYNVEEKWLRLCIESVMKQDYENWELCIADDCSSLPCIQIILKEYAAKDKRVKVVLREINGHISAASNSALELAAGEFVGLLDHDDELAQDALFHVAKEINLFPDTDFIYSDEDMIDEAGARYAPKFKPDFSRDFLCSVNYATHFAVYRTEILRRVGGFQVGLEGSQDYDLTLRVTEEISETRIRHIPKIIYHWRAIKGSVALSGDEKPYAHERAREAVRQHLRRTKKKARVEEAVYNLHRVKYDLPEALPTVSLIFSTDEASEFNEQAMNNFIGQTDYKNLQRVKVVVREKRSEAEQLNSAVAQSDGEILCFVDANLKPLSKDWLKELIGFAVQKEIGAVGAKLLYRDETVLHGGLIIGINGSVGIAHHRLQREAGGYFLRARLVNNFSAVSVSCLAVRREIFESIGGFDADNFPNKLFDVDFCLLLREKNYRIVFTPYAELIPN